MRCEARHREDRQPWVQCENEATVMLTHKSSSMKYCERCADRFIEGYPRGTFERKLLSEVKFIPRI